MSQLFKFVRFELSDPYVAPTNGRLKDLANSNVFCKTFSVENQDGKNAWAVTAMLGFNLNPVKLNRVARIHKESILYNAKYLFYALKDQYEEPQMQQATPHLLEWAINFCGKRTTWSLNQATNRE